MTLERRWLVTVVAFVAISAALEAAVGFGISHANAELGAKEWLVNSVRGAEAALVERMFAELGRSGDGLAHDPAFAAAEERSDLAALVAALDGAQQRELREQWLIVDARDRSHSSALAPCRGDSGVAAQLTVPRPRAIVWCGATPVLLAQVPARGALSVYLGTPLTERFVDELRNMSLNEIEVRGPRGLVATSLMLESGARATKTFLPEGDAQLRSAGTFARLQLDLDGRYAGYFAAKLQESYALKLASTGATRFDAFAYSAPLDARFGPADLHVVSLVPADMLLLGPSIAGTAMVLFGLLVTALLAVLAQRLIHAMSRPLHRLEQAARAAAAGEAPFEVALDRGASELSSLSASFAAMRRRAEESQRRASQSEKMAAVGTLAGGVAHEINNPLGVILGFAQGLERRVPEGDKLRLPVVSIVRESLRCKALVQELLAFSRSSNNKTEERVDVAGALQSSLLLIGARAKTQNVEIVTELEPGLPELRGSRTQLQQVLLNLGTNALDVMKQGGTLTLRASTSGGELRLEVQDTGGGIPAETQGRIFEPFFTTKPVGEGTGLGLSLVYQIVQQHHGRIEVASTGPNGTVMRVTLPAAPAQAVAA